MSLYLYVKLQPAAFLQDEKASLEKGTAEMQQQAEERCSSLKAAVQNSERQCWAERDRLQKLQADFAQVRRQSKHITYLMLCHFAV